MRGAPGEMTGEIHVHQTVTTVQGTVNSGSGTQHVCTYTSCTHAITSRCDDDRQPEVYKRSFEDANL